MKEAMRLTKAKSDRLGWVLRDNNHLLVKAVGEDTSPEARQVETLHHQQISEHVAKLILERADPTVAKTMTGWLIKQYVQGGLRLEDLGIAYETLDAFHRYAPKLPKGKRDLGQYPSLAKVWDVVSPIADAEQDKLSGKAQKMLDKTKAYAESRILRQDPDGFTVAVPMTEFAAKWWGKGTRWCTAAEKDNRFWQYHQQAPLIVMVIPQLGLKGKIQLWFTEREFQFMDAADHPVSANFTADYWPRFERLLLHALWQNGRSLQSVPHALRTEELCRIAVAKNGEALMHVPEALRTEELCRIAVGSNGLALHYLPQKLSTEEMCMMAVAQDGRALGDVPNALRTDEMCRIAVARHGLSLCYVPWSLRTEEMCKIAVAQDGRALQYVPEDLRTEEVCRIAVAEDGRALEYVPWDLRTDEMYRIAVAQNGWALEYVPQKLRTDELCRIAVARNGGALLYVPEPMRDRMSDPKQSPLSAWHLSLLDNLATVLGTPNSPDISGPPHV
jgi:hypothetical protein